MYYLCMYWLEYPIRRTLTPNPDPIETTIGPVSMAWTIRPATASDVDALYVMVEESYEKDDEFFIDYAKVCTVIRLS